MQYRDEFLLTNKLGGYSSWDLVEGFTRKYHSVLTAGLINFNRKNIVPELFTNFKIDGKDISLDVGLVDETKNQVKLTFTTNVKPNTILEFEFALSNNNIHELPSISSSQINLSATPGQLLAKFDNGGKLTIKHNTAFRKKYSYRAKSYPLEQERGYESKCNLFVPGVFSYKTSTGINQIVITLDYITESTPRKLFAQLKNILVPSSEYPLQEIASKEKEEHRLPEFIVNDGHRHSIIAGYHWFDDWGRDTFVSFKGLLLIPKKFSVAQSILSDWAKYIREGQLPNKISGFNYESIDAILFFAAALEDYYNDTGDKITTKKIIRKLEEAYIDLIFGRNQLGIDVSNSTGFLYWTDKNKALTWMDAKIDGLPVVDRTGAAIEIQALWFNALRSWLYLQEKLGLSSNNTALFNEISIRIKDKIIPYFWDDKKGYFSDHLEFKNGDFIMSKENQLRPNQLFLFAIKHKLVDVTLHAEKIKRTMNSIDENIYTKAGLRSLTKEDLAYKGKYLGTQVERDQSYHNGVIWPWLLIPYFSAAQYIYTQINQENKIAELHRKREEAIDFLKSHNYPAEIYDDSLEPKGAIAQAWSKAAIAELVNQKQKSY